MPPSRLKIHNVMTDITGRTRTERIVSGAVWRKEIQPVLDACLRQVPTKRHKAKIGRWVVEYAGQDPHMHEFFTKNWKPADPGAAAHVTSYVLTGIRDREVMKQFLGFRTEAEVRAHGASFLAELRENKKYRASFRDPRVRDIETFPEEEQLAIALLAPATVYASEERAFLSLNTNYYGQLKSKSSLGPLEEFLIRQARISGEGKITNPADVWLSMHAACVEYAPERGPRRGIVIIAPTGSGKSTQGYGFVEAKKQNRLHSDDWVFVNLGTREVMISEEQFYLRINIAEIYPHLIPLLVAQPLENVAFTPDMLTMLERFESSSALAEAIRTGRVAADSYRKLVSQMTESNAARSLIDPRLMVGKEKFIETVSLTDFFLFKRDYDSAMILQTLRAEEMIEVMTSKANVFNYAYGKWDADGYGVPESRTTEIYYNPYLCICEVDREKGIVGEWDKIRIEAYRTLARQKGVTVCWVNTRLPANQTQLCLRIFLEDGIDFIRVAKGEDVNPKTIAELGLQIKSKPKAEGRRPMDFTGFFTPHGEEAEVVEFLHQKKLIQALAFFKNKKTEQLAGWTKGTPQDFLKKYKFFGAKELLG